MKSNRIMAVLVALFLAGCGTDEPTYEQALQTYRTESEILKELTDNRQKVIAEFDAENERVLGLMQRVRNLYEGETYTADAKGALDAGNKALFANEQTYKSAMAELDAEITRQSAIVDEAKAMRDSLR